MGIRIAKLALFFSLFPAAIYALACFPGAEGFGTDTAGGRGGTVYTVTNLNNSGTGSFRAACEASGARYVVFRVSGDIHLTDDIQITNPYITIAGQTSPGGVAMSGGCLRIMTHDVVITHMRFRRGTDGCDSCLGGSERCNNGFGDSVQVLYGYNIVLDHCSITWGADECLDISEYMNNTHDITVSHCLIGAGCNDTNNVVDYVDHNHALGLLVTSKYQGYTEVTVTGHHNYIAHAYYRMPLVGGASLDWYNNVSYDWGDYAIQFDWKPSSWPKTYLNSRHNYIKQGPSHSYWNHCGNEVTCHIYNGHLMNHDNPTGNYEMNGTPEKIIHTAGNISCACIGDTTGKFYEGYIIAQGQYLSSDWISETALSFSSGYTPTITTMTSDYAAEVVAASGANRRQYSSDIWNDSVDAAIIADFADGTGTWIVDGTSYPTGWPTYTSYDPPTDADSDGMDDAWETSTYGSTSTGANDDTDSDGYTNLEEYLFYLGGYVAATGTSLTNASIVNGGIR